MARSSSPHATTLQLLAGFALGLAALPGALAAVSEVWWNVTYVDNVNPDGLFPRRVIGVNGTWPCVLSHSALSFGEVGAE